MEVISNNSFMPGDPRLVQQLVNELKSQGIFDQFRKECFADVDTKPAYQNLRQRVEGSVAAFLKQQTWSPDMNKNQVREQLKKNIYESGYLETGVERIVDQVVNPKISTVFLPIVEDVVYKYLGIEKQQDPQTNANVNVTDTLPKDFEDVTPESVQSSKLHHNSDPDILNDSVNSKVDDDESPPFEPLEGVPQNIITLQEETSLDSEFSGISGLHSHESNLASESKSSQMDWSWQDAQLSQNSSESKLSVVNSEGPKLEISRDIVFTKNTDSDSMGGINKIEEDTMKTEGSVESMVIEEDDSIIDIQKEDKIKEDKMLDVDVTEQKFSKTGRESDGKKNKERKSNDTRRDERKSKSSSHKSHSKDDKHSTKDDKHGSKGDKNSTKEDKHISSKDDKYRSSSSSKDKDKSNSRHSSSSKDRDSKDNIVKVKDKIRDSKDDSKIKEKDSKAIKEYNEKDRFDRDKMKEKDKYIKNKEKDDEKSSKQKHDKDKRSKKEDEKEKQTEKGKSVDREKEKLSKEKSEKGTSSKNTSERDRGRSKDRSDKKNTQKDREKTERSNDKSDNDKGRDRSRSSGSINEKSSSNSKEPTSSMKSKKKDSEKESKASDKYKKDKLSREKSSESSKDKKRESKKDDHYTSKEKKNHRRSFDRDSNDGQSGKNSNALNPQNRISSSQPISSKDSSTNSLSGSGDSGNSEANEIVSDHQEKPERENEIQHPIDVPKMKYIKPKFALNFEEAKRIMKIRRQLAILERQNQLSLTDLNIVHNGFANKKQGRKPKIAVNETENEDININDDSDSIPKTSPFRGFERDSEQESEKDIVADTPEKKLTSADLNLHSIFLSKENWEALEARLEEEMLKINFNAYESHYDDYDDNDCSTIIVSPTKDISGRNSCVIEEIIPRRLSDGEHQKSVNEEEIDGQIKQVFDSIGETEVIEEMVYDNDDASMRMIEELDERIETDNTTNHVMEKKELSIKLLLMGTAKKENFEMKTDLKETINEDESDSDFCTHFEKCDSPVRNVEILHKIIRKLEDRLEYSIKEYQNNILPEVCIKVVKRGRKRKFDENVDLKNNNRLNYAKITGVRKRGRPRKVPALNTSIQQLCNNRDIMVNQNFSFSSSPAENEISTDKHPSEHPETIKQRKISTPRMQRYTSDDLYKPRPTVAGTKRSKREKNP